MSCAVNCKQSVRLLNNIPKVIGTFTKHQPFKNIVISSRQFSCVKQINPVVSRKEILTANSIFLSQYLHKSFRYVTTISNKKLSSTKNKNAHCKIQSFLLISLFSILGHLRLRMKRIKITTKFLV